ncbi:mitochondrial regulator_of_chromosome_condensation_(RCC1)_repeat- containing_protein [Andalucia godoyi]|uniref:Mitochondrial regulator_of_chromosome_condensation_(RCC1)_repeat-containing_protein n=1 Tax=Andalucia godoyi TaxID=505711 RepID=A0A8K0F2Q4_ANDGO|nr:mitochondrial regulator_of_chromosome_condensation_(RCC1)_repeat- containing_protein [Andalucia godoyi]|eukprot:ANDGO_04061.mRNA.1 mitochondrial regulator_of_chromosome_condensation_(RCC1)_repeat- containing_protein
MATRTTKAPAQTAKYSHSVFRSPTLLPDIGGRKVWRVASGAHHCIFLTRDGLVYGLGSNAHGQLGLGKSKKYASVPTLVASLSSHAVIDIACGYFHTILLTTSQQVFVCGWNKYGQCVRPSSNAEYIFEPTWIPTLDSLGIHAMAAGSLHSVFATDRGVVYACGDCMYAQTGPWKNNPKSENLHNKSLSYFSSSGDSISGDRSEGERKRPFHPFVVHAGRSPSLSNSVKLEASFRPGSAAAAFTPISPALSAASPNSSVSKTQKREHSRYSDHLTLVLDNVYSKSLSCGDFHTLILDSRQSTLWTWGRNGLSGRLGIGSASEKYETPQIVLKFPDMLRKYEEAVCMVSCGDFHSAACTSSGSLYLWGSGENGRLGTGSEDFNELAPVRINESFPVENPYVVEVRCGGGHTVCRTFDGTVFAWGSNIYGKLGLGHERNVSTPHSVQLSHHIHGKCIGLSAGLFHTLFQMEDGSVFLTGKLIC